MGDKIKRSEILERYSKLHNQQIDIQNEMNELLDILDNFPPEMNENPDFSEVKRIVNLWVDEMMELRRNNRYSEWVDVQQDIVSEVVKAMFKDEGEFYELYNETWDETDERSHR